MYIKYHPDKVNPTDKDLFEEAFKFMLRQIEDKITIKRI